MLCSAEELGIDAKLLLPEQRSGIFILPQATPVGVDIKQILGLDDVVLDIDLTANRGDCTNILGLAREAAAVLGTQLKLPDMSVAEDAGGNAADMASIDVQAADLCSRFAVRVLKNIKIGQSPDWMQKHLRACGMRPISNVVDVTNYVMLELGQPMHAYDYDKVGGHTLIVRRAKAGEKLVTLDSQERTLDPSMITIADPDHAVGLGGVMGGLETEVTDATVNVMLEAATFNGRLSVEPLKLWACAARLPVVLSVALIRCSPTTPSTVPHTCWNKWEPVKLSAASWKPIRSK